MRKYFLVLALLLSQLAPGKAQVDSVLLIGNSYTYGNGLSLLFHSLALSAGDTFFVQMLAAGGYTLQSHLNNPSHLNTIQQQGWDYFIVQEQSQVPTIDFYFNSLSLPSALALDSYFRSSNDCAKVYYFMTWGRRFGGQQCDQAGTHCSVAFADFDQMQDTLKSRYLRLAEQTGSAVSPVGEAWRLALRDTTGLVLHTSDNSHPNLYGSYLTACTHYASIKGQSPAGLSYTAGLDPAWANYLQRKAAEAVLDSMAVYSIDTAAYPALDLSINGLVNTAVLGCQGDSLEVLVQQNYTGAALQDSLFWSLNSYDAQGALLHSSTFGRSLPAVCSPVSSSSTHWAPVGITASCLVLESSYWSSTGQIFLMDTLAVFPYTQLLSGTDMYLEAFSPQAYSGSYAFWSAEYDFINSLGWRLAQDATLTLAQTVPGANGAAIVNLPHTANPKRLTSPCLALHDSLDYEIRFKHANHRFDSQSQTAFRLELSSDFGFSQASLLHDFGLRYDSLFSTFVDTFSVAQEGHYYLGIEAYSTGSTTGTGLLGIDDFQIRALPRTNPTTGLSEAPVGGSLQIYPNPSSRAFYLDYRGALPSDRIRVFDLQGREQSHLLQPSASNRYQTTLAKGVYVLVVERNGRVLQRTLLQILE